MAFAVLTALAVYNALAARLRDRAEASDQISACRAVPAISPASLPSSAAGSTPWTTGLNRCSSARGDGAAARSELEELSTLVKQLADSVASHDAALSRRRPVIAGSLQERADPADAAVAAAALEVSGASRPSPRSRRFSRLDRDGIIALVRSAIEANRIDLYLQPIVTLPQRNVRFLRSDVADEGRGRRTHRGRRFHQICRSRLVDAEARPPDSAALRAGGAAASDQEPRYWAVLQSVRRDPHRSGIPQLLEFVEANRAIAPSLVFEFTQSAVRAMGPPEHESLAVLAERGFRFSMDNVADLRFDARELHERGFRFIKVPACSRSAATAPRSVPADFSDLLARFGIDVAERIESENIVVDLLEYGVRLGKDFCSRRRGRCAPKRCKGSGEGSDLRRKPPTARSNRQPDAQSTKSSATSSQLPPTIRWAPRAPRPLAPAGAADRRGLRRSMNLAMTSFQTNPLSQANVPLIERFAPLARGYDVLFCDVWGVVHNGVAAFADACEALARFRSGGGTAILLTNAPRPAAAVVRILDRLGVPRTAYDAIVSSGDVTRGVVEQRPNERMFHLGPQRDLPIFDGLTWSLRRSKRRLRGLFRPVRRHDGDAGKLSRDAGVDARAPTVHGLRQS